MTHKPVGIGVVGLGAIGKVHAKVLKELQMETGLVELVAVVDHEPSIAENVGKELGVEYYSTIYGLLKNPKVDVISIATPSYLHSTQAILAFEYGKDVIVEKPMAASLLAAKEMIKRARKYGRRLGVIFQERYAPDIAFLKSRIVNGDLGRVFLVVAEMMWYRDEKNYYLRDEIARSWRGMWFTEGGGVMTNQGIHTIDLILWMVGNAEEVCGFIANLTHPSIEVEDNAVASIKFRSGALGVLAQSVSVVPETHQYRRIRIFGTEGQAEIIDRELNLFITKSTQLSREVGKGVAETLRVSGNLHKALFLDFIKAYLEDREFPITSEEGYKSLELIKAVYLSSTTSKCIKLPLEFNVLI